MVPLDWCISPVEEAGIHLSAMCGRVDVNRPEKETGETVITSHNPCAQDVAVNWSTKHVSKEVSQLIMQL